MGFCPRCGTEVDETARFCAACGQQLKQQVAADGMDSLGKGSHENVPGDGAYVPMRRARISKGALHEEIAGARQNQWVGAILAFVAGGAAGFGFWSWNDIRDCIGRSFLDMPVRCLGVDLHPRYELSLALLIGGVVAIVVGLAILRHYNSKEKRLIAQLRKLETRDREA